MNERHERHVPPERPVLGSIAVHHGDSDEVVLVPDTDSMQGYLDELNGKMDLIIETLTAPSHQRPEKLSKIRRKNATRLYTADAARRNRVTRAAKRWGMSYNQWVAHNGGVEREFFVDVRGRNPPARLKEKQRKRRPRGSVSATRRERLG